MLDRESSLFLACWSSDGSPLLSGSPHNYTRVNNDLRSADLRTFRSFVCLAAPICRYARRNVATYAYVRIQADAKLIRQACRVYPPLCPWRRLLRFNIKRRHLPGGKCLQACNRKLKPYRDEFRLKLIVQRGIFYVFSLVQLNS